MPYTLVKPHPRQLEMRRGRTVTVPDQSMSVQEIMSRFTRGQRIPDKMLGYYDDQDDALGLDGVDFNSLDITEKHEVMAAHKQKLGHSRARYQAQMDKQAKDHADQEKARKTAWKEEVKKELEAPKQ